MCKALSTVELFINPDTNERGSYMLTPDKYYYGLTLCRGVSHEPATYILLAKTPFSDIRNAYGHEIAHVFECELDTKLPKCGPTETKDHCGWNNRWIWPAIREIH